ncbi:MAG: hypothetical protein ABWZ64_14345 [Xanthobacteraceae bacterium]|jgi:hypothetical protein
MQAHPFSKSSAVQIAILFLLLAAALAAPTAPFTVSAASSSRTFLLRVCNKAEAHYGTLDLTTASLTPDLRHMRVIGWALLPSSRCIDVGQFQKPGVYLYAMSGGGAELAGQGPVLCVNTKEKFDYSFLLEGNPPCPANYTPKTFVLVELPDHQIDGFTFTIE